jgi:transposase
MSWIKLPGHAKFFSSILSTNSPFTWHRLNRGGGRDANRALRLIRVVRVARDRRTNHYVARRTADGKSKREMMRCFKRYIAREAYRVLVSVVPPSPNG